MAGIDTMFPSRTLSIHKLQFIKKQDQTNHKEKINVSVYYCLTLDVTTSVIMKDLESFIALTLLAYARFTQPLEDGIEKWTSTNSDGFHWDKNH